MKGKKKKNNSFEKLFAFVVFTIACVLGLIYAMNPNALSSLVVNRNYKAAGDVPEHTKGLIPNGDGTYKLSLDVKGEAEKKTPKVNVIVIVDRSGSMGDKVVTGVRYDATNSTDEGLYGLVDGEYVPLTRQWSYSGREWRFYYNGNRYTGQRYRRVEETSDDTRMDATKEAVNSLASTLLAYNGKDGNPSDTVEMALVTFATTAQTTLGETTSSTTFTNAVNNISVATGNAAGTNWEAALKQANTISFGSDDNDPTFVIFFSDGAPTFYDRNNGGTNGTGYEEEPNMANSYNAATDDAKTLATKVGTNNFYTIFAFGKDYGATYMTNLTTAAGAPKGNNYSASDTTALQNAFNDILTKIEMAGIANATINDGTTHNVKTTSGQIANLLEVDEDSFKYYKNNVEWADAPKATFNKTTGEVEWDLSSLGVLENGVTYKVTFDVYPSQYTYDIVSEMKNGDLAWLSLDENVRKYLNADGTLNTNTSATLHYKDTRVGDQPKTADYTNPKPVATETFKIGAHKEWVNLLDDKKQKDKDLLLTVTRDGAAFHKVTLNNSNNYTINTTGENGIHIAPGLMKIVTDKNGNKSVKLLDSGHDYTFAELDGDYYNWDIKAKTIRPMIIDGHLHNLILVDENLLAEHPEYAVPTGMGSNTYYQENTNAPEFVKINGKTYVIQSGDSITVDATNNRRSNLNIVKKVDGADAPKDAKFDFSITVTDNGIGDNDKIYLTVFDTNECDAATGVCTVIDLKDVTGWEKETNANGWAGYYMAPSGTEFKAQLQDGWNVLVTNLTDQASYVITEGDDNGNLPEHFVFAADKSKVSAENNNGNITNPALVYTINGDEKTISGDIDRDNASYTVQVTNVYELVDIEVNKVWEDNGNQDGKRPQNGAVFHLYANGNDTGQTTTRKDDGKVSFTGLDRFDSKGELITYTVVEDKIDDYTTTPADATDKTKGVSDGATIINTHEPETTQVTITKTWDDANNQDGKRGSVGASVQLYKTVDGTKTKVDGKTATVPTTDGEVTVFKNLPVYEGGKQITYSVEETMSAASEYDVSGDDTTLPAKKTDSGTIELTNSYSPETTQVTITKTWDDSNNQDGKRGSVGASVQLYKTVDGTKTKVDGKTATVPTTDGEVTVFKNLPVYEGGKQITYSVEETMSAASEYDVSGDDTTLPAKKTDSGTIELTNSYSPEKTQVTITKTWDDANNQDGKRGSVGASVQLYKTVDGTKTKVDGKTATVPTTDGEVTVFKNLPVYEGGKQITYSVEETMSAASEYDVSGDKTTLPAKKTDSGTIELTNSYSPEATQVTITKTWDDANNQDGKRGSVGASVQLYKTVDGKKTKVDGKTATVPTTDGEVTVFKNLPVYEGGKQITYSVEETMSAASEYDVSGDDTTLPAKKTDSGTIELTNSYSPETTQVTITKTWDDANNQDGKRGSVGASVQLYKTVDGTKTKVDGKTATVPTTDGEVTVFKNLPVYEGGKQITYSVEEIMTESNGYAVSGDKTTLPAKKTDSGTIELTNTYSPEATQVTVTKIWDDANNQDGKRGSVGASVQLYKTVDGTKTKVDGKTATVPTTDGEVTVFKNLPVYEGGKQITYSVEETMSAASEYDVSGDDTTLPAKKTDSGTIELTNSYSPETTQVTVTKTWDDANNQDGYRSKVNAKVQLYKMVNGRASKVDGKTATVPTTDGKVTVFKNLPVYEGGNQIIYYVEETMDKIENMDKYVVTGDDTELPAKKTDSGTIAITNTHTPDTINIEDGYKVWSDADNQDGMRPPYIIVNVISDDPNAQNPVKTVEVRGDKDKDTLNQWFFTLTDLPRYRDEGTVINYSITESYPTDPAEYKYSEEYETDIDGFVITNTHDPKETEVEITKHWDDSNNQDGIRPDYIKISLYADKEFVKTETITPDDKMANPWTYKFTGLAMYKNKGQKIVYTIEEEGVKGYSESHIVDATGYKVDITNTHAPSTINIKGTKVWADADNQDGKRPEYINIKLLADKKPVEGKVEKVTEDDGWSFSFTNLPEFKEHGTKIVYSIEEEYPEGFEYASDYAVSISDITKLEQPNTEETSENEETEETEKTDGDVVEVKENTYVVTVTNTHTPEVVSYTITKLWDDENDNDGLRPESIIVNLLADGEVIKSETVTAADDWKVVFADLPKYKSGKEITYTITEEVVKGYEAKITVNDNNKTNVTILNKHNPEKTAISGTKTWQDDEKNLDKRPSTITIRIYADGLYLQTITVSNQTNWQYFIDNLYKYKNGKEITYTIVEDEVEDYTSVVNGFDITNIFTGGTGEVVPPNTGIDTVDISTDYNINYVYLFLATLVLGTIRKFVK